MCLSDEDYKNVMKNFNVILSGRISNILCIIPIRIVTIIKELKVTPYPRRIEKKKIQQMQPMQENEKISKVTGTPELCRLLNFSFLQSENIAEIIILCNFKILIFFLIFIENKNFSIF